MAEKKKNRYGVWFVIILLLVGLAGFGAGGFSNNIRTIGTVGDKELSVQAYQRTLNNDGTLSQLILLRTLDNEASQLGISVGDAEVLDRLQQIPQFRGSDGSFNRESYRFALQQAGQSEEDFEAEIREDVTRTILQAGVVSGIPTADTFADTMVSYISEQRSVTWATVDADDLTAPLPGPTEADQQAFYEENPSQFTLPETRNITYVWLTPDMLQDAMNVPDEAVAQLYENRSADFIQPERRLVERLVYADQAKADDARARLDAGEVTFEDLVDERGLALADIDLGDVDQESLGSAGDAVFSAAPGDVVGPFDGGFAPAFYRINAILAAQEITLEEASEELREELATDAAREVINDSTDGVIDLLAGGATLEDIADRTDMRLGQLNWTPDNADGIAAYEAFRAAANSVEEDAFAEVIDLSDGGIFALRLDGITPPALQPIENVRDDVISGWRAAARQRAVVAHAEEIAESILPLTDFETVGLEANQEQDLIRRSFVEGTPPGFNDRVFGMNMGEVTVIDGTDRAIIVRLDDIAAPDLSDPTTKAIAESLSTNASSGIAQDIFDAYANALRQQTDIDINQAAINAVNAQFQ